MKKWHFYDLGSGLFTSETIAVSVDSQIDQNARVGCGCVDGDVDHLSQRVDLATGKVIDYQPPQPTEHHEWHAESKRWRVKPEVQAARHADSTAQAAIESGEQQSLRAMWELLIALTHALLLDDHPAAVKLRQVDAAIADQRKNKIR